MRYRHLVIALSCVAVAVSCNAIFGLDSYELEPDAGAAAQGGGGTGGTGGTATGSGAVGGAPTGGGTGGTATGSGGAGGYTGGAGAWAQPQ